MISSGENINVKIMYVYDFVSIRNVCKNFKETAGYGVTEKALELKLAFKKLYLLHGLPHHPTSRSRKLTAHSYSFCMHLRFRLKDPIATPSGRVFSLRFGGVSRRDWLRREWGE